MNLSPHFTLEELTASQTAARLGLDNTPPPEVVDALTRTAMGLEGVRTVLGAPIIISSGYRNPDVNHAVGGQPNSQHQKGEAADFICPGFGTVQAVFDAIKRSGIDYDQMAIEYSRWIHISFSYNNRRQSLIIDQSGTRLA